MIVTRDEKTIIRRGNLTCDESKAVYRFECERCNCLFDTTAAGLIEAGGGLPISAFCPECDFYCTGRLV